MAHVLFITTYYPPEKGAAAVRISETAERLVQRGHQVTVLTTVPNYPTGIVPLKYRGHMLQRETLDEVSVIRVWSYISPNKGFLRRILAQFSFGCLAALLGWKSVGHPDVIIVESHPLFNAIAGRILAKGKKCPFIFMVSDLWPESAVQLGILRNRVLIWLSECLEWSTYQRASLIWALTAGIRDRLIQRGLSSKRIFLLTNGVDPSKFCPMPQLQARTQLNWDQRFTILYVGTHGLSHGLATLLDVADKIRVYEDIHMVLVGDGAEKANLIVQAQNRGLKNVTFLDPLPHHLVPVLLSAADVCLVHVRKIPLFQGMLPLKMFEAMACARPIVLALDGEARELAERDAGAAIYAEPENANALTDAILYLYEHPEECETLGRNGRAYLEARYDRNQLTAELDTRIALLLAKRKTTAIPITPDLGSELVTPSPIDIVAQESRTNR